jgi:hypothetical protein
MKIHSVRKLLQTTIGAVWVKYHSPKNSSNINESLQQEAHHITNEYAKESLQKLLMHHKGHRLPMHTISLHYVGDEIINQTPSPG